MILGLLKHVKLSPPERLSQGRLLTWSNCTSNWLQVVPYGFKHQKMTGYKKSNLFLGSISGHALVMVKGTFFCFIITAKQKFSFNLKLGTRMPLFCKKLYSHSLLYSYILEIYQAQVITCFITLFTVQSKI